MLARNYTDIFRRRSFLNSRQMVVSIGAKTVYRRKVSLASCRAPRFSRLLAKSDDPTLALRYQTMSTTKLKMPLGIRPLCLYHDLPMIPTQEARHPRRFLEETYYWFFCSVPGCNQHYDMEHGYYTITKGKREEGANKPPCPDCSLRVYLAKRDELNGTSVWLCANEECSSNKRKI
jgi:hypothetical protein